MRQFAEGAAPSEQVAGVLVALQAKGTRPSELAGFAEALRASAKKIVCDETRLVDTAGTGGGRPSFNLSTGAAIVAAAAGAKVAKHGNRSVTSACGSADVLEALGVRLVEDPARIRDILETVGIAFMFAPNHHGSLKAVGPVRKALGIRTIFNQLGPLANPAGAKYQLIGVYDPGLLRPMAEALVLLGAERAFVVHGEDGMDEVSPSAPTKFAEVSEGSVREGVFTPEDFGLSPVPEYALDPGTSVQESADILAGALAWKSADRGSALVPNAATAVYLAGLAENLSSAAEIARETMASGAATRKLEELGEASRQ
jgi:anthranilate phosphoribosyltransferase